ncbi:MAG: hypothetical protein M0002_06750 [Rhodospirillales bacterium]|nr:hypothetical protein [Rhodospirillales bacterium]
MFETPSRYSAEIASEDGYDALSISVHWASAGLILLDWLLGQLRFLAPVGTSRAAVISTHILLGLAIGMMLLARLAWRAGPGRNFGPESGLIGRLAKATHIGLYGLIGATGLAGISAVVTRGLRLFGTAITPRFDF